MTIGQWQLTAGFKCQNDHACMLWAAVGVSMIFTW